MNFTSSFFIQNRRNLFDKMKTNSVLVLLSNDQYPKNGDQQFAFRQQSDLYYFTGIKQEESSLLIFKNKNGELREILFLLKPNLKLETWEGKKLTKEEASGISGVNELLWNSSIDRELLNIISEKTLIYLLGEDAFSQVSELNTKHVAFERKLQSQFPKNKISSPRQIINSLRLVKSSEEIEMLQKAVDITNLAFQNVLRTAAPKQREYEIEAEISYVFRKNGAAGHAYDPIVASGENACSLHYIKNDSLLKSGDLLLMDFGADYNFYAADLSRTIPVNGKFTERQKKLYQLVLDIQKKAIRLFVPGNTIEIVNKKVNKWMETALLNIGLLQNLKDLQRYYPHGTSHFLGIDVHDVGSKDVVFEEGMVLTCEPGLYIEEESIGIRIENDIVVGKEPLDLMKNTIREIDEIEKAMQ